MGIVDVVPAPTDNRLGEFLRAQRARLSPGELGLPDVGERRVAGLRREEVADLARVSTDYYTRLEQGRERNPSPQVLEALAGTLQLGPDAREHVFRLARLSPSAPPVRDEVAPELRELMAAFPRSAAYVTNPAFRVLDANPTAVALIAPVSRGGNVLRGIFTDPAARDYYENWDDVAPAAVSALRLSAGFSPVHPEVVELVAGLVADSAEFRALWNDEDVSGLTLTRKTIVHPVVGVLHLTYQTFDVRSAPGQQLTVATAAVGSPSEVALTRLSGELSRAAR